MGVYSLTSSQSIIQSRDKLFSLQLLLKNGLEIPTTGVVLAETKKAAESVINAFKSLKANLLVQEFIQEADNKDIRCFVVNGKVLASIMREAAEGEFRANIHKGAKAFSIKITPEEKKMAIKATKILGLDVAGVDIIRSSKGPLLLEVNSSPGLEGVEETTGKDFAREIIISIEKKLGWKIPSADS